MPAASPQTQNAFKNLLNQPANSAIGLGDQLSNQLQDTLANRRKLQQNPALQSPLLGAGDGSATMALLGIPLG